MLLGLEAVHKEGIVHRDLKPDNIKVNPDNNTPQILDFGLAVGAGDDSDLSKITQSGAAVGTPSYMSPEQATASKNIDARSDIFSMGTVLYEMVTGRLPFEGSNTFMVAQAVVSEDPVEPIAIAKMLRK